MQITQKEASLLKNEVRYGDLIMSITGKFEKKWDDKGSGGKYDVTFYQPICEEGFYPLGSVAVGKYGNIDNTMAVITVKEVPGTEALKPPLKYERIWCDKGSGAKLDGACWKPIPPQGYVALGHVFTNNWNPPSLEAVRCVRKDLTYSGKLGNWIYDDRGTGAKEDLSIYQIVAPEEWHDQNTGLFAPGTVFCFNGHTKPETVPNVLRLPLPYIKIDVSLTPILDSKNPPSKSTIPVIDREVIVPMTSIVDKEYPISWVLENSPFYILKRECFYTLIAFQDNETSDKALLKYEYKSGISNSKSITLKETIGIEVSEKVGFELFGIGGEVNFKVNIELGFEETHISNDFTEKTISSEVPVASKTAVAIWSSSYNIKVFREDETQVGASLIFSTPSVAISQYPNLTTSIIEHRDELTK